MEEMECAPQDRFMVNCISCTKKRCLERPGGSVSGHALRWKSMMSRYAAAPSRLKGHFRRSLLRRKLSRLANSRSRQTKALRELYNLSSSTIKGADDEFPFDDNRFCRMGYVHPVSYSRDCRIAASKGPPKGPYPKTNKYNERHISIKDFLLMLLYIYISSMRYPIPFFILSSF